MATLRDVTAHTDRDLHLDSEAVRYDLYLQRLARTRAFMVAERTPAMLLRDPFNVRYVTGATNMTVFNLCVPARYLLVLAEGPIILFDYVGGEHLADGLPTIDEVRTAHGLSHVSSNGFTLAESRAMATEIAVLVREQLGEIGPLAVDSFPFIAVDALRAEGFQVSDADPLLSRTRRVKLPLEIEYLREAARRTMAAVATMETSLRPGVTENELWSRFIASMISSHGELVATRLLQSGPNTFPYFQECGTRPIAEGDLVCIDTDTVAFESYQVDFSRTFLAGDGPATARQRNLYRLAHEQLRHNVSLIRPGATFEEVARHAWPVPEEHRASRYYCIGHGIGMIGEYPNLPFHLPGVAYPLDDTFEPGMVFCVESYIGSVEAGEGVKLEDQLLVTDSGVEVMSDYPFEPRLLAD
jgi:Xaa-Pro aminopeptidase